MSIWLFPMLDSPQGTWQCIQAEFLPRASQQLQKKEKKYLTSKFNLPHLEDPLDGRAIGQCPEAVAGSKFTHRATAIIDTVN